MPTMDVTIEKLIYGGEGLAHHEGSTVFVPFVLPTERAAILPTEQKKKFIRARLERVLDVSPERISASAAAVTISTFPTKHSSSTKQKSCGRRFGASAASNGPARLPFTRPSPGATETVRNGKFVRLKIPLRTRHRRPR
jgi:predicted RNA-binding protein with TRAM domain